MLSNIFSQLLLNLTVSEIRSRISTYGSQTMRPKGQVTLVCDRKGKLQTIDFLVVDVSLCFCTMQVVCEIFDSFVLDQLQLYSATV